MSTPSWKDIPPVTPDRDDTRWEVFGDADMFAAVYPMEEWSGIEWWKWRVFAGNEERWGRERDRDAAKAAAVRELARLREEMT